MHHTSSVVRTTGLVSVFLLLISPSAFSGEAFRQKMISGHKYIRTGKYAQALINFDAALSLRPDNPIALKNCAKAYAGTGDWRSAEDVYLRYLGKTAKGHAARHYRNALSTLSDTERQLKILYKLYIMNRQDLHFGMLYIDAMQRNGGDLNSSKYRNAVEYLAERPGAPASLIETLFETQKAELVSIQTHKKLSKERDSYFWKAVVAIGKWQPIDIDTLYMSGQLAGAMKRYPVEKRFALAWASLQFHQKKYESIDGLLRKLPQSNHKVQRMMAEVAFYKKKYKEAIRHWHRVPRQELQQFEWEHLCQSLAETGKRREAIKEYGELYIVYPTSRVAKQYLKGLN